MGGKILVTFWVPPEVAGVVGDDFELIYPKEEISGAFSLEETKKMLPGVDGVLILDEPFTREVIECGLKGEGKLRAIGRLGVGCDGVDCDFAGKSGVAVINAPQTVTDPTAELSIALMLAAARNVATLDREIRALGKCPRALSYDGFSVGLSGKTLGIIGFGRIGKAVARKAAGLGMKVVYADVVAAPAELEKEMNVSRMAMEELLGLSDFVSVHCPYTPENHHLINEKTLGLMKRGAILVNASRGKMVDEAALAAALESGALKGAALDVFEFEPEVSRKLLSLDNVVMTPHIGTATYDARVAMAKESLTGMIDYLKGGNPPNIFNRDCLAPR